MFLVVVGLFAVVLFVSITAVLFVAFFVVAFFFAAGARRFGGFGWCIGVFRRLIGVFATGQGLGGNGCECKTTYNEETLDSF